MVKKLTGPNTAGQTLNPVVPYLMSESLEGSAFPAWLTTAHFSLEMVPLPTCHTPMALTPPTPWGANTILDIHRIMRWPPRASM